MSGSAGSCRYLSFPPLSPLRRPADPRTSTGFPPENAEVTVLTQILLAALVVVGSAATLREVLRGRPRRVRTRRDYDTRAPSVR